MRREAPPFEQRLRDGKAYEHFVEQGLRTLGVEIGLYHGEREQWAIGESRIGLEIKQDREMHRLGRVFIEGRERRTPTSRWNEGGILRRDNTRFYGIGNLDEFIVLRIRVARELFRRYLGTLRKLPTSEGVLVPLWRVREECLFRCLIKRGIWRCGPPRPEWSFELAWVAFLTGREYARWLEQIPLDAR